MKTARTVGVVLGAIGLAAAGATFAVYTGSLDDAADPGMHNSPNAKIADKKGVTVSSGILTLPSQAGRPASIAFTATNHTPSVVYITEARLLQNGQAALVDLGRVVNERTSNFAIQPGESLKVSPGTDMAILTNYNASVLPGAKLELELTLSDASTVTVPLTVESVLGQGGEVKAPGA